MTHFVAIHCHVRVTTIDQGRTTRILWPPAMRLVVGIYVPKWPANQSEMGRMEFAVAPVSSMVKLNGAYEAQTRRGDHRAIRAKVR